MMPKKEDALPFGRASSGGEKMRIYYAGGRRRFAPARIV
jgi:hypothetical protein